jgi:chromosome segregation ATPase
LKAKIEGLENSISENKSSQLTLGDSNDDLVEQIASLTAKLAEVSSLNKELLSDKAKLEEESSKIVEPIEAEQLISAEDLEALNAKLEENLKEIKSLKDQITELESKSNSLQREMEYSQQSLKDQKKEFMGKIAAQEVQIRELKGQSVPKKVTISPEAIQKKQENIKKT